MTAQAEGAFEVTSWDEGTYRELKGQSKLTKVTVVQAYTGGLEATSSWEGLMLYRDDGTAFFTGLQHVVGTLHGREGSFVTLTCGEYNGEQAMTEWSVVVRSATGDLAGLEGSGTATASAGAAGSYTFDYDLH